MSEEAFHRGKKPGSEGGTIYHVAKKAHVSISTVSKVFNDRPDISRRTRRLVLEAARQVHYSPVMRTRRLSVGLLVEDLNRINEVGFVSQIVFAIARQVTARGGVLELVSADDMDSILRNHVSGVIAVVFAPRAEQIRSLASIPVVLINNVLDLPNVHSVSTDHREGAYTATRHLLKCGHKKIGFMEILDSSWGSIERQRGFTQAMAESGLAAKEWMSFTCYQHPRKSLEDFLARKATALLLCGEDLSLEINQLLLHELNLRVPDQFSVVSYEVPFVSSILTPPQTTVSQPWDELGSLAVDVLAGVLEKQAAAPVHRLLPNRFLERQSVKIRQNRGGEP